MDPSCLRCGKCCTSFGVCITPFDVARIKRVTGKEPQEFVDLVPEPPERERKEPAILIDGERSLLVLKRDAFNVCYFYSGEGCIAYGSRPMLCRSYPFRSRPASCALKEMKSRACDIGWQPDGKEKTAYEKDCEQYGKEVRQYAKIADEWNSLGGGDFGSFLDSIKAPGALVHCGQKAAIVAIARASELKKFHSSD